MRILHLIESIDPARGGPPQVAVNLACHQALLGHEVAIATYGNEAVGDGWWPDLLARGSVSVCWLGHDDMVEKLTCARATKQLVELIPAYDVVHIHGVWESIKSRAARIARRVRTPYVFMPHGMLDPYCMLVRKYRKRVAMRLGVNAMLKHAAFVHVLNEEEKDGIHQLGVPCVTIVIPNGVKLDEIDAQMNLDLFPQKFPELSGTNYVLFLSRLHRKKGLDILADVAHEFLKQFPDWRFVIAGPDDGAQVDFTSRAAAHGIESKSYLIGPVYGALKYSTLANASCFCLPSRQEGFSVAILEAMASRLPVVVSENCHFGEIQDAGAGYVTPLRVEALTRALVSLAQSADRRRDMGQKGRALVEQKYTWNAVAAGLVRQYEQFAHP